MLLKNPLELFAVTLIVLIIAVEVGFRFSKRSGPLADEARREQVVASRDALGILLSLLLGFTLAMALPRYDLRKELAIDEANAIGTTNLRAQVFSDARRDKIRTLLEQYTEARIAFSIAGEDDGTLQPALRKTSQLQSDLWAEGTGAARENPTPITALFLSALNKTIDLSEKRLAALQNRIPISIWIMLLLISLLTCLTFGYSARNRFWMISVISPLMISIVVWLIADLDSARSGLIRTDYSSLVRVQNDLRHAR